MKIAVVGNYTWVHYQQALLDGFRSLSESSDSFPIKIKYFPCWNIIGIGYNTVKLWKSVKTGVPDALFLYRVDSLFPCVLAWIKRKFKTKIIVYHNDDPYNKTLHRPYKHRLFLKSLKYSDITYVYREVNLLEAKDLGAHHVKLLRSYYYSKLDILSQSIPFEQKKPYIVFIGHYEDDSRIQYLSALFQASINVHVYGSDAWRNAFEKHKWPMSHLHGPLYGQEYRACLNSAYAALAFYSLKNRDDYTRRCFEIPMAKTLLFAPRTAYMCKTFVDGQNAMLFSSIEEMVQKAKEILNNPRQTEIMSIEGYNLILHGGFSECDAASRIVSDINEL